VGNGAAAETFNGPYASRTDAIQAGRIAGSNIISLCEATNVALTDEIVNVDDVLEDWHCWNEDASNEDGDLFMDPTEEQTADLQTVLNAAFAAWRARHGLGHASVLADTRNCETIDLSTLNGNEAEGLISNG
jgi:hypothetical protein